MSTTTLNTNLAAITGTEKHYFRIVDTEAFECACCKAPLQAAYESFATASGGDLDRNGIASFCVPCVQKGGRGAVLEGVRNMVKEMLASEQEPWEIELWNAVLDQFEMGYFEIQSPATDHELVLTITHATAKHAYIQAESTVSVIRGMIERLDDDRG